MNACVDASRSAAHVTRHEVEAVPGAFLLCGLLSGAECDAVMEHVVQTITLAHDQSELPRAKTEPIFSEITNEITNNEGPSRRRDRGAWLRPRATSPQSTAVSPQLRSAGRNCGRGHGRHPVVRLVITAVITVGITGPTA